MDVDPKIYCKFYEYAMCIRAQWCIALKRGYQNTSIAATANTISSIPKKFLGHVHCTLTLGRLYVVGFCALSAIVDFLSKSPKFLEIEFTKI